MGYLWTLLIPHYPRQWIDTDFKNPGTEVELSLLDTNKMRVPLDADNLFSIRRPYLMKWTYGCWTILTPGLSGLGLDMWFAKTYDADFEI